MTDQIVTLRLTANADGVVTGVKLASGEVEKLGAAGQQAGTRAAAGMDRLRSSTASVEEQLASAKRQFLSFIGAATVTQVLRGLVAMSDEIANINGKLKLATRGETELATARAAVFAISQRTNTELASTAALYSRLAQSAKDYGISQQRQLALVETINKTFAISGATAEAQKNAITQFTQSLAGGVLRAEEFNSVIENSPRLAQALADGMGMSMGQLRKAVNEGQISVQRMLAALENQSAAVAQEFSQMPLTVERAWTNLRNAVTQTVGDISAQLGAGSALASGIAFVAEHVAMLGTALVAVAKIGAVGAVFYVGGLLQRGFVAIATAIALTRAPLAAFEAGLAANAVAAQGMTLRMAAAAIGARGLAAALALIQANPVALAITAVTLLATWLVHTQAEAKATAEALRTGFQTAKKALEDFNRAPSFADTFRLEDAKIGETIKTLREELERLRKEKIALDQTGGHMGLRDSAAATALAYKSLADEVTATQGKLATLEAGVRQAAAAQANLALQSAGVTNATPALREQLAEVAREGILQGKTLDDIIPKWRQAIQQFAGAEAAARLTAQGITEVSSATQKAAQDIDAYTKSLAALDVRIATAKYGKAAGIGLEFKQKIDAAAKEAGGGDITKGMEILKQTGVLQQYIELMNQTIAKTAELDAAEKAQAEARKAASEAARDQARAEREKLREDNAAFQATQALNALIRDQQSLYGGPVAKELNEYQDAVAKLEKAERDLAKAHRLDAEAIALLKEARTALDAAHVRGAEIAKREQAEIERSKDLAGEAARHYDDETRAMLGSAREREVQRALIEAETAARQQYSKGLRENIDLQAEEISGIRAAVERGFDFRQQAVEQQKYAESVRDSWVAAASDATRAFGDWFANGLRGGRDFARSMKDIIKRLLSDMVALFLQNTLVRPFQNWLQQIMSGAGQAALGGPSASAQGGLGQILNSGFDRLLSGFTSLFSRGGPAADALQTATQAGFQAAKAAGLAVVPSGPVGGMLLPNGQLVGGGGSLFGGMGTFAGVLGGAAMGWGMGGDTLGKIGGGLAGGALAYSLLGVGGGLAGLSAGMAAGGLFGGLSGMLGAMGPIGWVALGAIALNSISGGKLFGTSFKPESASQQWSVSGAGASGSQSVTEVRQRSFFRGREWRTTTSALDADAMAAVNELFAQLQKTVQTAAQQLGIAVPEIVGGTFKREFDKNGNLTREFGTIAGRVYNEAQEAFAARLVGENMLAVAKAAGSAAELEQLANAYRGTGEQLQAFAALALSIQEDLLNANGIWKQVDGDGVMTRIVHYIEGMAKAGESLADAYARIQQAITQYGDLIGGVRAQIATRGLNQYQKAQLEVELAYRQQVKQANDLAKALGLSGARAEDLAAIEQLRALNMADLAQQYAAQQKQNDQWLQDLALSNLSPLTDAQKLSKAMELLQASVADGDIQRSQKLAEQVLGLGRNLYASGEDYNALYAQVTALVGDLSTQSMEELQGLTNEQLADLADLVSGLPAQIAQALAALLVAPPPPVSGTTEQPVPLPPTPTPVPPPPSGGGGGGGYSDGGACVAAHMWMDDGTRAADADAGNVHGTHDPVEGFARHSIRVRGMAVLQPCMRLVTASGAALVCSASTPFTAVDAPADLPEYSALAPDMLGREVIVSRGGLALVERVVSVQDAGQQLVVPLDFGGRSFAAGEDAARGLIYSHNMQKAPAVMVGEPNPYGAQMVGLLSEIASTNAEMARRDAAAELNALNAGSSLSSVY